LKVNRANTAGCFGAASPIDNAKQKASLGEAF
jgi:hypothetical protein